MNRPLHLAEDIRHVSKIRERGLAGWSESPLRPVIMNWMWPFITVTCHMSFHVTFIERFVNEERIKEANLQSSEREREREWKRERSIERMEFKLPQRKQQFVVRIFSPYRIAIWLSFSKVKIKRPGWWKHRRNWSISSTVPIAPTQSKASQQKSSSVHSFFLQ